MLASMGAGRCILKLQAVPTSQREYVNTMDEESLVRPFENIVELSLPLVRCVAFFLWQDFDLSQVCLRLCSSLCLVCLTLISPVEYGVYPSCSPLTVSVMHT